MEGGNKLSRIRTFQSDLERADPNRSGSAPAVKPVVAPIPAKPAPVLPPVLLPKKPLPPPPTPKPLAAQPAAPAVPIPAPAVPAAKEPGPMIPERTAAKASSGLSGEIESFFAPKQPAVDNERLNVFEADSEISEGTIITDQKRERFKLLPAMIEAVRGWFTEGKVALEERAEKRRQAVPTVRDLKDRESVVKKAAKQSALAPKDDHRKLTKKLPEGLDRRAATSGPAVVIKEKDPDQKPSWDHFEGVVPATPEPSPIPAPAPTLTPRAVLPPVLPAPPMKSKPVPAPTAPSPSPAPTPISTPVEPPKREPEPPIPAATPPEKPATPQPVPVRPAARPKANVRLGRLAWIGTAAVFAIAAAGGGTALTWWFFSGQQGSGLTPTDPGIIAVDDTPLRADMKPRLPLPRQRTQLYELVNQSGPVGGVTALIPTVVGADGGEREATAAEILQVLSWQASAPLLRSIERLNFGTYDGSPYIVMKVTSFDTAFGGLLAAEPNLSADLSPLFGAPVTATFDPNEGVAGEPFFVDDVAQNHDVRILRDELQKERLIYGFVNKNTVIIATDRESFRVLVNAIR